MSRDSIAPAGQEKRGSSTNISVIYTIGQNDPIARRRYI